VGTFVVIANAGRLLRREDHEQHATSRPTPTHEPS
jgi:Zn2+/Cd2+-exporting ATPase